MGGAINSQVKNMGGLQSGILGVVGAFASAAGAAKAFNATIGEAAKFEASEVAIKAIFNDEGLSDSYLKMVDKMAIDSPLLNSTDMLASSKGLIAMTKDIDDLGKSWGIIEKLQVLDPTQGTDGATFALKEMFQGDSLSMVERFGLNKQELNRIKKLSIPKQIAEINSMLDGMGITEAAINKMGSTTVGYWAQIGERADKFKRTIGGMGNSKIGEVLGGIVDKLDSIDLDAIAAKIDARIGGAVQKVIDFSKRAWEMREPILAVAKAVGTFVGTVAGIVLVVKSIGLVAGAIGFLTSPLGLLAFAIIGLSAGFKAAYEHSEPFRKVIDGIVGAVKGLFAALGGNGVESMDIMTKAGLDTEQIQKVYAFADTLKGAFGKVKTIFKGVSEIFAGNKLGGIATLLESGFSIKLVGMITAFASGLRGAFDQVKAVFAGIGTLFSGGGSTDLLKALGFSPEAIASIHGFVEMVKTKIGEFVTHLAAKWELIKPGILSLLTAFMGLKDTAVNIFTTLWGALSPIFSAVMNALTIVADIAVMVFRNIIVPAVKFAISVFQMWWKIIGPILTLIGSAIGAAFAILKVAWDTILAPFANFLTTAFKGALESLSPLIEGVGGMFDWLGGIIKTIAGWFDTFTSALGKFKVPAWLSKLGGGGTVKFESTETMGAKVNGSHFHGIDRIPTDNYLAKLHKGERILTRQEADSMDARYAFDNVAGFGVTNNNQTYVTQASEGGAQTSAAGFGDITINMHGLSIREEADVDKVAEAMYEKLYAARSAG